MPRRIALFAVVFAALSVGAASVLGQDSSSGPGPIVVADVKGPLDQRALDFLLDAVETPDAQAVVLQLDNPGIASGDPGDLYSAVLGSERMVAVWVGPAGAVAYGGAGQLLRAAEYTGAAPGAAVGYLDPHVVGSVELVDPVREVARPVGDLSRAATTLAEADTDVGLVDTVVPTIGQFIAGLDGFTTTNGVVLETVEERTLEDGTVVTVPSVEVRFLKPGLFTRFLRLASRPEATFFFLAIGLAAAAFEFYAAGAGVTAGVAAVALFLAGYGLATLPMNWFAVLAVIAGMVLYTADFQRNRAGMRAVLGSALLLWGGFNITDAAPQFRSAWWAVIVTVVGIGLFYVFALTTVVRARFSTRTIGREYLVGKRGVAETGFDPEGVVTVDGGRWRARSHRAAGLGPGDAVEVLEVKGILLEVGPVDAV